jgi:hypothetical protein
MPRSAATKVQAKELSPALRRRLGLVPDDQVSIAVNKRPKPRQPSRDPWVEIRGTLSNEEADEMMRAIYGSRRNKTKYPKIEP